MHVLLVSDSHGIVDGVSLSVATEIQHLRARGHRVSVVSTSTSLTTDYLLGGFREFYRTFDADPRALVRRLRADPVDVAYGHCVGPQGLYFLVYLAVRLRVPMVNRFTTYMPDYLHYTYPPGAGPATRFAVRLLLETLGGIMQRRMSRLVLSIRSPKMESYLIGRLGVRPTRLVVNRLPALARPGPRRRYLPEFSSSYPYVFLTAGRVSPEKNHLFLVDLWNTWLAERYPRATWVIAGDGPALPEVRSGVCHADRVRWIGTYRREDIYDHMARADVLLHASTSETFGLVITEAKLCGLAIIALGDSGGGIDAQIGDGVCGGYLAADRDGFLDKLDRLLRDPEGYRRLSEAAVADVVANYGRDQLEALIALLQRVHGQRRAGLERLIGRLGAASIRLLLWQLPRIGGFYKRVRG